MKSFIKFNINHYVKAKLTDFGKDVLAKEPIQPKIDNEGNVEMQAWEFFNLFGPFLKMGSKVPFETTILIEDVK